MSSVSATAGKWVWHIHHMALVERSTGDGLVERARYINNKKPSRERPRRLRLMKEVKAQEFMDALQKAIYACPSDSKLRKATRLSIRRAIALLHAHECKRCPWDGHTIFPKRAK